VILQAPVSVPAVDASLVATAAQLLAFAVGAALVGGVAGLVYRWYTKFRLPVWLSVLFGLSLVSLYLNTVGVFSELLGGETGIFSLRLVVFNVLALAVGASAAPLGRLVGDRIATDVFAVTGARELDVEVSRLVRSVGRITDVTLPEETDDIGDIEGYDPVAEATKETLAGKVLIFPRRLSRTELEARLVTRLQDDYDVGHVDVELAADGTVEYLALGSRVTGIGPTLAPGTVAVAVRADPANAASPGDRVQVWGTDPRERLLTAELRAHVDDVATLAVNEEEATRLDAGTTYRLVTLPAEAQADREFASLLRAADETMYAVTVAEGSDLAGAAVASIEATVVAVEGEDGAVDTLPHDRTLVAGDEVFVVCRAEAYRRLDARGRPPETQSL
jgi:hypothetical protein